MATSASEKWGESAKSPCNYVNQHEKTAVMKGLRRSLHVPATERQLSSQVIALLHNSENISVVIKICGQPTYSGIPTWTQCCHFASALSCLLLNCILMQTKAWIQHVPMTKAKLLMFPEPFFTSPDKSSHWGGLSFGPATQSLPLCVREERAVLCGTQCACLFCQLLSSKWQLLGKKINMCKNELSCSSKWNRLNRPQWGQTSVGWDFSLFHLALLVIFWRVDPVRCILCSVF